MRFTCRSCGERFDNRKLLFAHKRSHHITYSEEALQENPWTNKLKKPWTDEEGNLVDERLRDVYFLNRDIILRRYENSVSVNTVKYTYNFPVVENEMNFRMYLNTIFDNHRRAFKINGSFGFILRHVSSGEYRFFVPYYNNVFFDRPPLVSSATDLEELIARLEIMSIEDELLKQRPNTKWIIELITNITFTVYDSKFCLGDGSVFIPSWLKNRKGLKILSLKNDYLCAFRCLAFHRRKNTRIEKLTKSLFRVWRIHKKIEDVKDFKGILLPDDIPAFEEIFGVSVNIFQVDETTRTTVPMFLSSSHRMISRNFSSEMNLCCYKNHLTFICDVNKFSKKYKCRNCDRCFPTISQFKRHERRSCWKKTIYRHPGGYYNSPKNVFQRLSDEAGIEIGDEQRYFEWFAMFDFEALLLVNECETNSDCTKWSREHRAVSVAISSNVPGFTEPRCIVDENTMQLVKEMFAYLNEISVKAESIVTLKLRRLFDELEEQIVFWSNVDNDVDEEVSDAMKNRLSKPNVFRCMMSNLEKSNKIVSPVYNEWEELSSEDEEDAVDTSSHLRKCATKMKNSLLRLRKDLYRYCRQLPIMGFNSGSYDLNLIKEQLGVMLAEQPADFIVKKNNQYMCVCTERFRFLDVCQYLPPGTSYSQFLKTFKVCESKGYFCFEYLDSFEKLSETSFPPLSAFWSSLKNKNTLEDERYEEYIRLRSAVPERQPKEIASMMNIEDAPRSKEENYELLRRTWKEENMSTLKDLLIYYNKKDVGPGILAIKRLMLFYFEEMKVDIFKVALSAPGVARSLLFRFANREGFAFSCLDEMNRDLFETIQANNVGGPAIIFSRHHKANETFIRKNENKPCRAVVGYDANALYLYCLAQEMPISYFVRWRRRETSANLFYRDRSERYILAFDWLDWIAEKDGLIISHKLNSGSEKCVGPYLVDGYSERPIKTVYEFLGCYWHQHPSPNCPIYKDSKNDRYERTMDRERFLKKMGYEVVSMWECNFKRMCSVDRKLRDFIDERNRAFNRYTRESASEKDLIEGVLDETFFGMLEVDIHVPAELYHYFSEMSPIFVTCKVPFKQIGKHMQDFVNQRGLSTLDRTLLVGGMRAERVLIATPLLRWYLTHGLVISKIYQGVEYGRARCFQTFTDSITAARRMGDVDPDKKILGELNKLLGNSAYGGLLMQKHKHRECKFVRGDDRARMRVNSPQFISLTPLKDEHYEIIAAKKKTVLNMPTQIGYFVLQYAKLRMLEFYYDFLSSFVDRSDFQLCQMDTDSLYFAISGEKLSEIIRPNKIEEYNRSLNGQCDAVDVDARSNFLPRTCCTQHSERDKRTPGLFKLESFGCEMVSLNSKTYVLQKDENEQKNVKLSSKGINKSRLVDSVNVFKRVLNSKESHAVVNSGFRARSNTVFTYHQKRSGVTYLYCKRLVQDDGISTEPLDLVLYPAKLNK